METLPKIGMKFEQVRSRLKRYDSVNRFGNERIKSSMINQVKLCEGQGAANELKDEFNKPKTVWGYPVGGERSFSGRGNRQIGWGEGRKFGDGTWRRNDDGKWEKVKG